MELSPSQAKAYDKVGSWLRDTSPSSQQVFRLFGWAGTGKTTLAKYLVSQFDGVVMSATYTGKAASVMRRKGMGQTQTIHRLIYRMIPPDRKAIEELMERIKTADANQAAEIKKEIRELNQPKWALNEESDLHEADLLVIDEVSMVGQAMGMDLESFGKKILVLGDPGQLPPIEGAGYFTEVVPDVLLTEIHRQAADNPIIKLATDVRNGGRLRVGTYGDSRLIYRNNLSPTDLTGADQVLVGRNATRRGRNILFRNIKGFRDPLPIQGDRVICLKNDSKLGLFNGSMFEVANRSQGRWLDLELRNLDEDQSVEVSCHPEPFIGKELADVPPWLRKMAQEFDYGYAITVHKAQGSQWPHVMIENESYCFREQATKWLYTALTRAEEKVTVSL